jgi:ribosomal protein L25 (general stress protein Ctc)
MLADDDESKEGGKNSDASAIVYPQDDHNVDAKVDQSVATALLDTKVPATEYQLQQDLVKEVMKSKDALLII